MSLFNLRESAIQWSRGRNFFLRLPLLLWMIYTLVRHLSNPEYQSIIKPLNLGLHELGHFAFMGLGQFWGIAGGSIVQLLIPIFAILMFLRQPDFFAISFTLAWLSTNFFDIAAYIGDAVEMTLPLVSPFGGENTIHDWNYLLTSLNLLERCQAISNLARFLGVITMLAGIIFGIWLLVHMWRTRGEAPPLDIKNY
ncbi:MAG: hypothetical protein ABII89_08585 [Candidatus Omnitrophota bacterium]